MILLHFELFMDLVGVIFCIFQDLMQQNFHSVTNKTHFGNVFKY